MTDWFSSLLQPDEKVPTIRRFNKSFNCKIKYLSTYSKLPKDYAFKNIYSRYTNIKSIKILKLFIYIHLYRIKLLEIHDF